MNASQHNADIQYKESFITECSITNNVINMGTGAVLKHELEVSVSEPIPSDTPDEKEAYVKLILDGTYEAQDDSNARCKYHMEVQGAFAAKKTVPDDVFMKRLWFNGSSTLYGIARAKMEVISAMILNNGKISLPMLNMFELLTEQFAEAEKKETQK